jgi:SigmaK-factor processing regulatory protein BofA
MEPIILILLVVLVLVLLGGRGTGSLSSLVINGLVGIVLLFLTNLFLSPPIPINIITVLICAIGGVVGWLLILILHILGIAFYVAV